MRPLTRVETKFIKFQGLRNVNFSDSDHLFVDCMSDFESPGLMKVGYPLVYKSTIRMYKLLGMKKLLGKKSQGEDSALQV